MMTRAVGQHARVGGFVARHDARLALDPFGDAVAALLGIEGKADADGAAVRLAALLARADRRRGRPCRAAVSSAATIVAGVEPHAGGGAIGQLGGASTMLCRRSSNGSRPISRATSSTSRSMAKQAPGRATPR